MTETLSKGNLVVVVGPTAVGKTDLSVWLAERLQTEVVSADSRQMYQEMAIGTAKPTPEEMRDIPHHFIDDRSVQQPMSAGDYEREAVKRVEDLLNHRRTVVVAGGSGLYVKALLQGFDDMPEVPAEIRIALNERLKHEGLAALQAELQKLDPEHFQRMDIQNPQRVVRALEVCLTTGQPYSEFRQGSDQSSTRPWNTILVGLNREREELYERINLRMDMMLEAGLIEEAKALYPLRHLEPLQTVGYREVFSWMDGEYDEEEMIRLLKRNSRHYAKRQLTWFTRQHEATWFEAGDWERVGQFVDSELISP